MQLMNKQKNALPLIWYSSEYSHVGHRRSENEDAVYSNARTGVWCVADGMGGHAQGRFARQSIIETVAAVPDFGSLESRVKETLKRIFSLNEVLFNKGLEVEDPHGSNIAPDGSQKANRKRQTIGCTFVILLSDGLRCTCLWAGDSRLYLLRQGNLFQITEDHTVVNDLIAKGILTQEQSVNHPQSHIVTRALGASDSLLLEKKTFLAKPGDHYLLCSDGLYNELDAEDISSALAVTESSQGCRLLIDKVLKGDAADNLTACVISGVSASTFR